MSINLDKLDDHTVAKVTVVYKPYDRKELKADTVTARMVEYNDDTVQALAFWRTDTSRMYRLKNPLNNYWILVERFRDGDLVKTGAVDSRFSDKYSTPSDFYDNIMEYLTIVCGIETVVSVDWA